MTPYLTSPFHDRLAPLNETNRWEGWAGFTTASVFSTVDEEYVTTRQHATVYDTSPLRKYRVSGPDAERLVDRLITRSAARIRVGQVAYASWCDDDGKLIEDGTVFRLAEDVFQINAQEPQLRWFQDTGHGLDARVEETTETMASLAIQGPMSREILLRAGIVEAGDLRYFRLAHGTFDGAPLLITRTGFTGDLGFELWVGAERALALIDRLFAAAAPRRLLPLGSAALNLLRLEAGHVMVNAEYRAANLVLRPGHRRSPFELGLEWTVDLGKDHFTGRRALAAEQARGGPPRRLVGLDIAGRKPGQDAFVYDGKREVGLVSTAAWSPILKKNIALASVEAPLAGLGTGLEVEIWHRKEMIFERALVPCTVVSRPFYDPPRKRD
jgi:aminomethyltransferase